MEPYMEKWHSIGVTQLLMKRRLVRRKPVTSSSLSLLVRGGSFGERESTVFTANRQFDVYPQLEDALGGMQLCPGSRLVI